MRIFVSYASERHSVAEKLSLALRSEGHEVFFDRTSLPDGEAYAARIRQSIEKCQLFLFLISPESIEPKSYTLSELHMISARFLVSEDRVLPVMIADVPMESVPNYLHLVTILEPVGDLVAEVLGRVSAIAAARRWRLFKRLAIAALLLLVIGAAITVIVRPRPDTPAVRQMTLLSTLSVFHDADQNSEIIAQIQAGQQVTVTPVAKNPNWVRIQRATVQGWAMVQDIVGQDTGGADAIKLGQGYGFQGSFWKLFFTSPQPKGVAPNKFGIDIRFADAITRTKDSLDIAVFELNNATITDAIVKAYQRGVKVRVVTDQRWVDNPHYTYHDLIRAGVPLTPSKPASGLMHDKFAVLDHSTVWTGSWNYTDGATYNNNENAIVLEGKDIAARYTEEFNRMFAGEFGKSRPRAAAPAPALSHGVRVLFAPEDPILPELTSVVSGAKHSIAFLTFSFTVDELADVLIQRAQNHVVVRGIFEKRLARGSSVARSFCNQSAVQWRLDTNPHNLHHDVFVVDDQIVVTGSLNFSRAALERNDENVVIIPDPLLARKYLAEFDRLWATAEAPNAFCSSASLSAASAVDTPQ